MGCTTHKNFYVGFLFMFSLTYLVFFVYPFENIYIRIIRLVIAAHYVFFLAFLIFKCITNIAAKLFDIIACSLFLIAVYILCLYNSGYLVGIKELQRPYIILGVFIYPIIAYLPATIHLIVFKCNKRNSEKSIFNINSLCFFLILLCLFIIPLILLLNIAKITNFSSFNTIELVNLILYFLLIVFSVILSYFINVNGDKRGHGLIFVYSAAVFNMIFGIAILIMSRFIDFAYSFSNLLFLFRIINCVLNFFTYSLVIYSIIKLCVAYKKVDDGITINNWFFVTHNFVKINISSWLIVIIWLRYKKSLKRYEISIRFKAIPDGIKKDSYLAVS